MLLGPALILNALDTALFMSRLLPREIALLTPAIRKASIMSLSKSDSY